MDATPEEREKIRDLAKKGKIKFANPEALDRINTKSPDFTVTEVRAVGFGGGHHGGMEISWATKSAGFGTLTFWTNKDGKITADTEGMSKEFCKEVFNKLVESWSEGDY